MSTESGKEPEGLPGTVLEGLDGREKADIHPGQPERAVDIGQTHEGGGTVSVGVYACSPEDSSFTARFTNIEMGECAWQAHDGQAPDEE